MGIPKGEKKKLTDREAELIEKIAKKLKEIRKSKGVSYETFAFDCGLPRMQVYRLEKGDKDFLFTSLMRMLDAHKISLNDFFKDL